MGRRPAHVTPPAYLSPSPPCPKPDEAPIAHEKSRSAGEKQGRLEPTRYGDWEQNGIAIDF